MTSATIAFVQLLYLLILYWPLRWRGFGLRRGESIGLGYVVANGLAILVSLTLDVLRIYTAQRAFFVWLMLCLLLNAIAWRFGSRTSFRHRSRVNWVAVGCLIGILIISAYVHLAAPRLNTALAGTDSYVFLNLYARALLNHQAVQEYPAGFVLATALAPWAIEMYDAARWAPPWVYLACLAAGCGFWRRTGGLRFALILTFSLGTAWFLYPITAFYPNAIQWTFGFVGIPALLVIYARGARHWSGKWITLGVLTSFTITMTSAYFALYTQVIFWLLKSIEVFRKTTRSLSAWLGITIVALVAPLTLLFYYGILARFFFTDCLINVSDQSLQVIAATQTVQCSSLFDLTFGGHPLLRVILTFLSPTYPLRIVRRWIIYWLLMGISLWGWQHTGARHQAAARLLAGLVFISVLSAMTGVFELPAWEGRNVFVSIFAGFALILWIAIHKFPRKTRPWLRSPRCILAGAVFVAVPALIYPPMIGRNVPVSEVMNPRSIPADNEVIAELLRPVAAPATKKRKLAIVQPAASRSRLIENLMRIHLRTAREHAFRGYEMTTVADLAAIRDFDAFIVSRDEASDRPAGFILHTCGPDYLFFVRDP